MKNIKMIVSDLDRTIVNEDGNISDYTVSILQKCREKGILLVFATARDEVASARFIEKIEPDAIVSNGGAMVTYMGSEIHKRTLPLETANGIIKSLSESAGVGYITANTEEGYFTNQPIDKEDPGWFDYYHAICRDFDKNPLKCGVYKLTVEIMEPALAYAVTDKFEDVKMIPYVGEVWYSYAHVSAAKWEGIKALSKYLSISPENIVAFGDDYNDVEMLEKCGIGVAVANAVDEVKRRADEICESCDDDGVAKWLESWCLFQPV